MSLKYVYPEKIPEELLEKNYVDDIILYALGAYGPLQKAEFNKINKTTFYKYLNSLIEKGFLFPPKRKRRIATYEITPSGHAELMRRLGNYNLDFYEMIELERKKIRAQVLQLSSFFEKYDISDDIIKIDFLSLYNNLVRDKSLSIFSEEQFNKLILYLVLNDIKFFKNVDNVLALNEFIEKYDVDPEVFLTKTDINMFIQEVVDKNRYRIKIYKVLLNNKDTYLFFREDSEYGIIFETIIKKHLRNLNYLKSLNNSEIFENDMEEIMKPIIFDLIKRYRVFKAEIEQQIFHLVEDFITDLQIELHEKPFVEFDKIGEYYSIYSPWVGLTHPFKPLSEEDEQELKDVRTTFKHIREKEPKNEHLWAASNFLYEKRLEEALIEVNICLEMDPRDPETLELKSRILYDLGDYKKAIEILEDALLNKTYPESTYEKIYTNSFKAELFLAMKRYDEALVIIKKDIPLIFKEDEEFNEIEFFKNEYIAFQLFKLEATILYEQKNYSKALEAIDKDLEYSERFIGMDENEAIVDSYLLKSKILNNLKKREESINMINKALKLRPNDPELLYQSANFYLDTYSMKAFFSINKALSFKPNNEKYQKLCDLIISFPYFALYDTDLNFRLTNEIFQILDNNQVGMTSEELNHKLNSSAVLKENELMEGDEIIEFIDSTIKDALEKQALQLIDGDHLQNSDKMKKFLNQLEKIRYFSLKEHFYMRLLDAYKNNDWGEISKENLISKLILNISGDKMIEIASSLIDNLVVKGLLTKSKGNFIAIDKDQFEKQADKLKYVIEEEETKKYISVEEKI